MTTPSTPAGWYPDPDGSGGQRYWDGFAWTEHRSPSFDTPVAAERAADEFPASEQATSVVSLPDQPTSVVPRQAAPADEPESEEPRSGAHRAPEAESAPVIPPPSYEPPFFETPAMPSWETPSYERPAAPPQETPSFETPSRETPSYEPPSFDRTSYEAPSFETPSFETPSYEAPQNTTSAGFAGPPGPPDQPVPPYGPGGSGGGPDNRKLLIGFLSAVGALLVVLVLLLVYAFVIRDDQTTQIASPGSSTSSSTATSSETSETETSETETSTETTTPSSGDEATEGDFVFSVASTEVGDTVTSPINEYIAKTATGQFVVVYLNVANNGSQPLTFLSTLQQLTAGTDTFAPDDEASFYLGGGVVTIEPGQQVETAVAFDVPVGTVPTSIQVHGEPGGVGVELPL